MGRIPEYAPYLGEEEKQAVIEQMESGWVSSTSGSVEEFEEMFSQFRGSDHALAVDSGTAALHLALESLEVDGDVVVQDYTYGATAMAVLEAGGRPVIIDIEPETFALDPEAFKEEVPDADAVMVAHMLGLPADMDAITEVAEDHGVPVVEDAAHTLGGFYGGEELGSLGEIGCFSFSWSKNITTGKGGMAITDDQDLARRMREISNYGRSERYEFSREGYNYQMDGIRASIGISQLEKHDSIVQKKEKVFQMYREELEGIEMMEEREERYPYFFYLLTDRKDELADELDEEVIGSRHFYRPLHRNSVFEDYARGDYPVSEGLQDRILGLPSHPGLGREEVERVSEVIRRFAAESGSV